MGVNGDEYVNVRGCTDRQTQPRLVSFSVFPKCTLFFFYLSQSHSHAHSLSSHSLVECYRLIEWSGLLGHKIFFFFAHSLNSAISPSFLFSPLSFALCPCKRREKEKKIRAVVTAGASPSLSLFSQLVSQLTSLLCVCSFFFPPFVFFLSFSLSCFPLFHSLSATQQNHI